MGIELNIVNWTNCAMYVQDIKDPGINIAAAISKNEAQNFKKMCSLFATAKLHSKFIEEYASKMSSSQFANKGNALGSQISKPSGVSIQSLTDALIFAASKTKVEDLKQSTSKSASLPTLNIDKTSNDQASINQALEILMQKLIDFRNVYNAVTERTGVLLMERLLGITNHERFKREIISSLTGYVKSIDSTLEIVPFGSNQYNLNESGSNFNLFVFTGMFLQSSSYY